MTVLAKDGGPKVRTTPWPTPGKRFGKEELQQLKEALDQNTLFYMYGSKTKQMCAKMGKLCGAKFVVPCSSGSAAIHGAVKASGVGPGDEVITSPITDAGTLLGILYEGAIPVFADLGATTYNVTAATIAKRITPRTRAVIVVHLAGAPADIKPIVRLCKRHKLKLIEDCAQSWGAKMDGQWVGTFGDFGCFSLNDFKHISAGDGGLIVTNDENLYRLAWLSIDKCYDRITKTRGMDFVAPNYRITELQSAVAIAQLDKVKKITAARHQLGDRLSRGLRQIKGVLPHGVPKGGYDTYWFYLMQLDTKALGVERAEFCAALRAEGIPCGEGYVQPVYLTYKYLQKKSAFNHSKWPFSIAKKLQAYEEGLCPAAERSTPLCVNLGIHQCMTNREIDDIIAAVKKVAGHYWKRKHG